MKKFVALMCVIAFVIGIAGCAWGAVSLSAFPDPVFREYLKQYDIGWYKYDSKGNIIRDASGNAICFGKGNGILEDKEIEAITDIELRGVTSLKGWQHLTSLKYLDLDCNNHGLTTLDVDGCTSLRTLECHENQLMTLDVSGCTSLTSLNCYSNQLTSLNVSGCSSLTSLNCYSNQLTSLNVSGCSSLTSLNCYNNQLTSLNVSGCSSLTKLDCSLNQLTSLNVSGCMSLTKLDCYRNQLTSLNVSGYTSLRTLECHENQLTSLNASGCTSLEWLQCYNNQLMTLDVSGCTSLTKLDCSLNQLTSLNASGTAIESLTYCGSEYNRQQLTSLDVSNCTSLRTLDCSYNQLMTLDANGCTSLTSLNCQNNQLTSLNVDGCTSLEWLQCYNNQLTTLDVSGFTSLIRLACSNNQITSLINISQCLNLKQLFCDNNKLSSLDVSNATKLDYLHCSCNELTELKIGEFFIYELFCGFNHLTELDLSQSTYKAANFAISPQTRRGLKVKKTSEGYEVDMKDFVPHLENIDVETISPKPYKYNTETGIAVFSEPILSISYGYITHVQNLPERYDLDEGIMSVIITAPLTYLAIERSGFETDGLIISGVTSSSYIARYGNSLTESDINEYSSKYSYSDYGKSGLAADGNSRLILRVQTDKPGTVSFSFNDDIGAKLESLSRKELLASDKIDTTYVRSIYLTSALPVVPEKLPESKNFSQNAFPSLKKLSPVDYDINFYQASAVLIAPERFPEGKNFPSYTFSVHVKFTDEDGEITEDDLELKLEAAPVMLIHGLNAKCRDTFGIGENSGIWHSLTQAGFDVNYWDYDGRKGPEEILSGTGNDNGLYTALTEVFRKYANRGIVCTRADFVCHSMGGLMARKYLDEADKDIIDDGNNWSTLSYKQGMARRVVTVATPHRGSPFAEFALKHPKLARMFFGKDCTSAFTDLMMSAPRNYGFPADVPMYSIYGDISEGLTAQLALLGASGAGKFILKKLPVFPNLILPAVAFSAAAGASIAVFVNEGMFHGEGHDIVVAVSSAISDFAGHECGYKGWDYMHTSNCHQDITGRKVASLLEGDSSVFKTFGASAKTAVSKSIFSAKKSDTEELKLIKALNLKIEPSVFTVSDNNTSHTVKFNVTASNPAAYDIYCAVEAGNAYRLFKLPASKDGKNFSAQLVFESQDSGVMNAFCFSQNPNDNEGKSLHISNTVNILALSDVTSSNIISLDFAGASTKYTSVNSEIPAGLYAVDADGRYYDISSPLNGTQWTSTEIARVNENGCIHGLKEGSTTLTATFRGLTASVNVEVSAALIEEADTPPEILTETLSNAVTNQSYSLQLKASGTAPITWTYAGKLPAGLTLSDLGLISGTPKKAGKSTFTVTAQNDYGKTSQKYTLQVFDPVSITTASLKAGTIGKSYSVTMRAKGTKPITWTAEGLPNGLIMNEKGRISGKSTVYGMFNVKVRAENGAGITEKTLQLTVKAIAPKLSGSLAKPTLNQPYSSSLKVTGSTPITWSIEGNLPEGITLDASTGIISGTPTSYAKSGYKITLTATNDGGSKSKKITLKVNGKAPKITAKLPQATAGENYSAELTATGSEPITFTADIPEYLTLEGNTITGNIPESAKNFKVKVYATNAVKTVSKTYTVKVIMKKKAIPENLNNDTGSTENESEGKIPGNNNNVEARSVTGVTGNSSHEEQKSGIPDSYIIVAELGEISSDEPGMYNFDVELPDSVLEGSELIYIANSDSPSSDDEIVEFYDEVGGEISAVPENRRIAISIWLNPETVYNPVIAVKD